jgi:hypothetical protein
MRRPVAILAASLAATGALTLGTSGGADVSASIPTARDEPRPEVQLQAKPLFDPAVAEAVAHQQRLRDQLGIPASVAEIQASYELQAKGETVAGPFGLALTSEELEQVTRFRKTQARLPEVSEWARQTFEERYAGTTLDQRRAGAVIVVRVADVRQDEATTRGAPTGLPIAVEEVAKSLEQLETERQQIENRAVRGKIPFAGTYVDERANEVVLSVPDVESPAAQGLARSVEARLELGSGEDLQINKDQPLGYQVVEGGQQLEAQVNADLRFKICTSGFAVQSGYGPFILTAGHCGYLGERWFQGGPTLGIASARNWPTVDVGASRDFDALLISTHGYRNNAGRVHISTNNDFSPVNFLSQGDAVGMVVCQTGWASTGLDGLQSSKRCGAISATNWDPGEGWNPSLRIADYKSLDNDSGAAVYQDTYYGRAAEGIHRGCITVGTGSSCRTYPRYGAQYSYMPIIVWNWALALSPTL